MIGKIIVVIVVFLIIVLVVYLMSGSGIGKKIQSSGKAVSDKIDRSKEKREIEVVNGPVLQVKNPGERKYHPVNVTKKEYKIGRGKGNDLVLDYKTVEERHAVIVKRLKGDRVFYEFINYAKTNPTEYFNKRKNAYEYLGVKDGVELDAREMFFVGDTKIIITLPQSVHMAGDTEGLQMEKTENIIKPVQAHINRADSDRIVMRNELDDI